MKQNKLFKQAMSLFVCGTILSGVVIPSAEVFATQTKASLPDVGTLSNKHTPTSNSSTILTNLRGLSTPTNLKAIEITKTKVHFQWDYETNEQVIGYLIYRNGKFIGTTETTEFSETNLTSNTRYRYTVVAYNEQGMLSKASQALTVKTNEEQENIETEDNIPPSIPTSLKTINISSTKIHFEWKASTDNIGVAGYQIYRDGRFIGTSNKTEFKESELQPETTYYYTVKAYDAQGNLSKASNLLIVKTESNRDTEAPSIPTNLVASEITTNSVRLKWKASTDNVKVQGYRIYRNQQQIADTKTTDFVDTDLAPETTYMYTIVAYDQAGNMSTASQGLKVVTLAEEKPTEPEINAPEWQASKSYSDGDIVQYQGKLYRAKWWTKGDVPGSSQWGPWEQIEELPTDPEEPTDPESPVDPQEPTDPEKPVDPQEPTEPENKPNFGVGQGIKWPEQVVAPFVDMSAWVTEKDYNNNGAPNLKTLSLRSGNRFFNLGFMQGIKVENGKINWAWGAYKGLGEATSDNWQYAGIKKSIRELREVGGDITMSFGGLNTGAFWSLTDDEKILENAYQELIDGYGLTRIDFDVEGATQGYKQNLHNARAIKRVQNKTGVEVVLTLPVMPFGLIGPGLGTLQAYLEAGVNIKAVNIMTMCYGSSVKDYAQGSIDAVESTKRQVQDYYKKYAKTTLSDQEAYRKIGTTPSIGFENAGHPYFSTEMMKKVVDHAKERQIGMVSFWSINRDAKIDNGAGQVKERFEYTNVAKLFGDNN